MTTTTTKEIKPNYKKVVEKKNKPLDIEITNQDENKL
jgi:hypothetical protein